MAPSAHPLPSSGMLGVHGSHASRAMADSLQAPLEAGGAEPLPSHWRDESVGEGAHLTSTQGSGALESSTSGVTCVTGSRHHCGCGPRHHFVPLAR